MEDWQIVDSFDRYEVSTKGRVRNRASDHILKSKTNQYGVVCVGMMKDGIQFHRSIPLLVATAFVPRPHANFDTPINLDGDRYNNMVENLVWRPRWFAVEYNRQFKQRSQYTIDHRIKDINTGFKYRDSFHVVTTFGLLEKDLVLAIMNMTYVWPTYQQFETI